MGGAGAPWWHVRRPAAQRGARAAEAPHVEDEHEWDDAARSLRGQLRELEPGKWKPNKR